MNILGIVAEFNPLHTGHEYLIRKLRRETGAAFCVVVMSGDHVQRGEPAFFAKSLRTQAALLSGADLVLELPLSVATGSAEYFAEGAVSLLDCLGCVSHLGFGSESGDIDAFRLAGKLLSEEPEAYRVRLQKHLKAGMSFPKARYEALADLPACILPLLTSPNNILGVEYCKALHKLGSSILPVTTPRLGAGYHETLSSQTGDGAAEYASFPSCDGPSPEADKKFLPGFASASGLRKAFLAARDPSSAEEADRNALLQSYVPAPCRSLYAQALRERRFVTFDDLFLPLYHTLRYSDAKTLAACQDVSEAFAERLLRLFGTCSSVTELGNALKTKNLTSTRINRALLHILLGLTKETVEAERKQGFALYARILGFRRESRSLLSEIDRRTAIPLVSKPANASKMLSPLALSQLKQTMKASEFYRAAMPGEAPQSEYAQPVIIL